MNSQIATSNVIEPVATAAPELTVTTWSDVESWDRFVAAAEDGTVCHLAGWKSIIEQAYGQQGMNLAACRGSELCGVLPLVRTESPLFGAHLTSMPYLDYGGILAKDEEARRALFERACKICEQERVGLTLRNKEHLQHDQPTESDRVTMLLELGESTDESWSRLSSERRNRIRKARKNGLEATWHHEDGLRDFYSVFARNMRDLGSPVHGLPFFRSILQTLPEHVAIVLVREGKLTIGAAFCLFFRDTMSIPWVSSLRSHFKKCPNQVIYWEAMRYGITNGYRVLDFGRSARGDGTFEAKRQWGAQPTSLNWVHVGEGEPVATKSRRYETATRIWQRLPLGIANSVGPWIRKGLPN